MHNPQATIVYAIIVGSVLLMMLSILVTPRKVNVLANYWLALFLFSFACIMLDRVFVDTHIYEHFPTITGLLEFTRLAMAPALYFSVLYFTWPDRKRRRSDYFHFVPFAMFFVFIVVAVTGINESPLFTWYSDLPGGFKRSVAITLILFVRLQFVVYLVFSFWTLIRHTKNIRVFASTTEPVSLWWLRYFLLGLAVALLLSFNEGIQFIPALVPFTHFGYLLLVFYLAYFSMRQQEIYPFQPKDVAEIHEIITEALGDRPAKRFSEEELSAAKVKLLLLMENGKPYLDPNLGLPSLAASIQLSTHDLSYVINEGFGENFFQFINRYRVEEAKILLRSDQHKHLSILGIAYESGFRSKSTFNATFKKVTGSSPSEFMKSGDRRGEKAA